MRIDTLDTYEALLNSGLSEEQAKIQARFLAKAGEPDIDLKLAFEKIDNKFNSIEKDFAVVDQQLLYLRLIGFALLAGMMTMIIKHW